MDIMSLIDNGKLPDTEVRAYLTNILRYSDIDSVFSSDKININTFQLLFFFAMNEDMPLSSFHTISKKIVDLIDSSNLIVYKRNSDTEYIPVVSSSISDFTNLYMLFDKKYVPIASYLNIDYVNGTLNPKAKKLYKLYNIRTAVALNGKTSYRDLNNLDEEISRILYSVSPKVPNIPNGTVIENAKFDLDGRMETYNDETPVEYIDSDFVEFIKDITGTGEKYSTMFMNINGRLPDMFTTDKIAIFSALLNFSKSELDNTKIYLDYLKDIYPDPKSLLYNNWDSFRILFVEFLDQLSERTIHYY